MEREYTGSGGNPSGGNRSPGVIRAGASIISDRVEKQEVTQTKETSRSNVLSKYP